MNDWIPYEEINFFNNSILQYHIDTRDFCCLIKDVPKEKPIDLSKTKSNPSKYFCTNEEAKAYVDRFFTDSGGPGEWRFFSLLGEAKFRTENWQAKYIRIYRFEQGLIFTCGNMEECFVMGKHFLSCPVNQNEDILCHH